jgi:hypothetical protein
MARGRRAGCDLLHVDARAGVEHRAALAQRDDGDRAARPSEVSVVPSIGSTAMSMLGGDRRRSARR